MSIIVVGKYIYENRRNSMLSGYCSPLLEKTYFLFPSLLGEGAPRADEGGAGGEAI